MDLHDFKHPRQSDVVHIEPVDTPQQLESFLRFPWQIYRDDPYWVPPYLSQIRKRLDIRQNPFFKNADRQLFCACWNGKLVGTIAGIVNHQHNQQLQEQTGFFGFFETINDRHVASALIDAVIGWLAPQNIRCLRGPVNGAPTDEVGVLICGHESRPALWEGHTPRYYQTLIEDQGFEKYDDVFAYEITYQDLGNTLNGLPQKLRHIAQNRSTHPLVEIHSTNNKNWDQDVLDAHYVYNTAFRTIPGHIDMSLEKFRQMVNASKDLMDLDLTLIAKVGNLPVGFAVALPDINEALRHFDGEVSKWEIARFYWHKWHIRTACFKLLGVLPEYRGRGIEAQIMYEMAQRIVNKKYDRVEISLASEKNIPMNRIIRRMGGRLYRAYRIYQRTI